MMDVNVASMFLTCRAVVPVMREPGRREDREHLVGHAVPRRPVPPALRDVEGRDRGAHARAREGARQGLDPRELRRARVHDVGRREVASRGDREAARRLRRVRAPSSATRCPRTSSARSSSSARRPPTSSPARRWSSTAASTSIDLRAVRRHRATASRPAGNHVVYDLERDAASSGRHVCEGAADRAGSSPAESEPRRVDRCGSIASTSRPAASPIDMCTRVRDPQDPATAS